jgi:AbrB family looped-hinge helix DNA binding protein
MNAKSLSSNPQKKFYGTATVSERGQIVIPAEARRDFDISPGEKLLVFGDLTQGIAFAKLDLVMENLRGSVDLMQEIERGQSEGGSED